MTTVIIMIHFLWYLFIRCFEGDITSIIITILALICGICISIFFSRKSFKVALVVVLFLLAVFFLKNFLTATLTSMFILYFLVVLLISIGISYGVKKIIILKKSANDITNVKINTLLLVALFLFVLLITAVILFCLL